MAKKSTGLAAFTRPKSVTDVIGDISPNISPSHDVPVLKKKRGGGETVALTVKVRRNDWQRLRQLADAEGTTIQAMAEDGFSAVLAQFGLPPINPHTR